MGALSNIRAALQPPLNELVSAIGGSPFRQQGFWGFWTLMSICAVIPGIWLLSNRFRNPLKGPDCRGSTVSASVGIGEGSNIVLEDAITNTGSDALSTDPGLLKKHSTIESYTVKKTGITYPAVRTFYRPHPQGDKLPSTPRALPLLVFVHGLGGCIAQFHPLLTSLVNVASCLAIDLPGHGLSEFSPKDWDAYRTEALTALLATAIEQHRDAAHEQGIVLIGHSMGCLTSLLLASHSSPCQNVANHVLGLIAICPPSWPPAADKIKQFKRLLSIPEPIFDIFRQIDKRGGANSSSVKRFVGPDAEPETKQLQLRFNEQSRTPVWRRVARGSLPDPSSRSGKSGLPDKDVWAGIRIPVFLIAGECDKVTPPDALVEIAGYLGKAVSGKASTTKRFNTSNIPDAAAPIDTSIVDETRQSRVDSAQTFTNEDIETQESGTRATLKTTVFPAPAAHALLYAPSTARVLAGLIEDFLADCIDKRLSLGWQLQTLTTEGKWDVKNLAKWQAVTPVSQPVAGIFRAMKTLREVDERHAPKVFVKEWADKVRCVIDISHESPVYDPKGLEAGGVQYIKFPTVSKLPPTLDEVKHFITIVDRQRESLSAQDQRLIGVHCHYGFNRQDCFIPLSCSLANRRCRTGFFIVCYLIERLGYRVQDAIEEFREKRPPGIRHDHFVDTLYVRYSVGLKRTPTL